MDVEICKAICYSLAKAYTTGVRLYQDDTLLYYYSLYHIEPDPIGPFLHQITDSGQQTGIITTPLCQFYAFLTLEPGLRLIIGPTRAVKDEGQELDELLAALQIEQNERENYIRWLYSAPLININRLTWLLVSLATVLYGYAFPVEEVWIEEPPESSWQSVQTEYIGNRLNNMEDMGISQAIRQSLSWEQLVAFYIEAGKINLLRETLSAQPKVYTGNISGDGVRQMRNWGIGITYSMSKAAIRGGLDPQQAFITADSFIRKMELLKDTPTLVRLIQEMMLDFCEQVETLQCPVDDENHFCRMCIQYISHNIFSSIRLENMAKELGYSRPYMCSRFKQDMGISLAQYIQQEKVEEARRLLRFSDYNLSEIASMLSFSSQSHFQTVFKKITGDTPMAYRRQMRTIK